ncbi:MAG: cytochrome c maturation protein CcmE [Proteobacteria bacterium]|nr:cytochrome c maturation protein CcmE [Pseudomonadota bacterium]
MNMKKQNLKFIIGGVLIIGIATWIFGSISSQNLTYYYTPGEVSNNYDSIKDETIRVMGMVKAGSLNWVPRQTKLEFQITDEEQYVLQVEYTGAKPDMFREGQGAVVEGKLTAPGQFQAETLLVKHSEEYKVDDHTGKKEDYYKSLQQ